MSLSYFNVKKLRRQSKQQDEATSPAVDGGVASPNEEEATSPVLDEEDQKFLERLAAIANEPEGPAPPLPTRPKAATSEIPAKSAKEEQDEAIEEALKTSLPTSPPEVTVEDTSKEEERAKDKAEGDSRRKSVMSYFALAQSKFKRSGDKEPKESKEKKKDKAKDKEKGKAATDLHSAAEASKNPDEEEAEKEKRDLTEILDQLNLSAINNRVFSFSKESQDLLDKFKLVLKDIVNGVPTAYDDLEKLLTNSEGQLKKLFGSLPPFLQSFVKSLPTKISAALAPELMAAQAEKPGFDAKQRAGTGKKSKRAKIPSLKSLISAEGAVATMLRSILNFLKLRFPAAITGTNVLLSLAVFLLLFVFWYCHKRGRETRLEREKLAAEADSAMASSASSYEDDGDSVLNESAQASSSRAPPNEREKPDPPLILRDNEENTVDDLPSVSHLPEPTGNAPTPQKEEPLRVPGSK